MKLQILKPVSYREKNYKSGEIVKVLDDGNNNPIDKFWRNRIKDSEIDECVKILKFSKTTKKEDKINDK